MSEWCFIFLLYIYSTSLNVSFNKTPPKQKKKPQDKKMKCLLLGNGGQTLQTGNFVGSSSVFFMNPPLPNKMSHFF